MSKSRPLLPPGMRKCPRCGKIKSIFDFNGGYCKSCYTPYHREWAQKTRKQTVETLRQLAFEAYGGKCRRCGETNQNVLQILPRGSNGIRAHMYKIRREGYPDTYYLLCANCEILEKMEQAAPVVEGE